MKHWHETAAILERLAALAAQGKSAALATVVRISGSAYRRPGAKLLVEESGQTRGGISGGCLESDVRAQALETIGGGEGRLLHYETSGEEEKVWGLGLGCEGAVDLFVQRIDPSWSRGPGAQMRELIGLGVPFAPITLLEDGRTFVMARSTLLSPTSSAALDRELTERAVPLLERGEGDEGAALMENDSAFVDVLRPPPRLFIFGAGDDAQPLAALAAQAGFDVTLVDHRPAYLSAERFPPPLKLLLRRPSEGAESLGLSMARKNFAVVQTHALQHDQAWLKLLATQPLAYLGLLGPRTRKEQVLSAIALEADKLYAPVGLDIGADGPEQVAISIVAEMLAVHARRAPAHLRARAGGIHER